MADLEVGTPKAVALEFIRDDGSVGPIASVAPWTMDDPSLANLSLDSTNMSGVLTPVAAGSTVLRAVGVREDGVEIPVEETLNIVEAPGGDVTSGRFVFTDIPTGEARRRVAAAAPSSPARPQPAVAAPSPTAPRPRPR